MRELDLKKQVPQKEHLISIDIDKYFREEEEEAQRLKLQEEFVPKNDLSNSVKITNFKNKDNELEPFKKVVELKGQSKNLKRSVLDSNSTSYQNIEKYKPYILKNPDVNNYNFDTNFERSAALNQSFLDQYFKATASILPKAFFQIVGDTGSLISKLDVNDVLTTENGVNNVISEWAEKSKEKVTDSLNLNIFRENPNKDFDIFDSGYLLSNASDVVASAVSFVALGKFTGGGTAKLFNSSAKFLEFLNVIGKGSSKLPVMQNIFSGANALTTAYLLNTAEGHGIGISAYNTMYKKQILEGKTEEEAKQIASGTYKKAYDANKWNMLLNITGAKMLLKPFSLNGILKPLSFKNSVLNTGREMAEEFFEEDNQFVIENNAISEAYSYKDAFDDFFSLTGIEQGAWGAFGAGHQVAFTGLSNVIPLQKNEETGKRESFYQSYKKRYFAQQEDINELKEFKKVKNLTTALDSFMDINQQLKFLKDIKNAKTQPEKIDLINKSIYARAVKSFRLGTQDELFKIFDDIAKLTPEQAETQHNLDPKTYKQKAKEIKKDLKNLEFEYFNALDFKNGNEILNKVLDKFVDKRLLSEYKKVIDDSVKDIEEYFETEELNIKSIPFNDSEKFEIDYGLINTVYEKEKEKINNILKNSGLISALNIYNKQKETVTKRENEINRLKSKKIQDEVKVKIKKQEQEEKEKEKLRRKNEKDIKPIIPKKAEPQPPENLEVQAEPQPPENVINQEIPTDNPDIEISDNPQQIDSQSITDLKPNEEIIDQEFNELDSQDNLLKLHEKTAEEEKEINNYLINDSIIIENKIKSLKNIKINLENALEEIKTEEEEEEKEELIFNLNALNKTINYYENKKLIDDATKNLNPLEEDSELKEKMETTEAFYLMLKAFEKIGIIKFEDVIKQIEKVKGKEFITKKFYNIQDFYNFLNPDKRNKKSYEEIFIVTEEEKIKKLTLPFEILSATKEFVKDVLFSKYQKIANLLGFTLNRTDNINNKGAKSEKGSNKIARLDEKYVNVIKVEKTEKFNILNFIFKKDSKNKKVREGIEQTLDYSILKEGEKIKFVVLDSVQYEDGTIVHKDGRVFNTDGTITQKTPLEVAPIAVFYKGKQVEGSFLHLPSWITSKNITGNVEEDLADLLKLREYIIENGESEEIEILERRIGFPITNDEGKKASEVFKSGNIKIKISKDTTEAISLGSVYVSYKALENENDTSPLKMNTLKDSKEIKNTILNAFYLYLQGKETNLTKEIYDNFNLNILNYDDFIKFIETYIFVNSNIPSEYESFKNYIIQQSEKYSFIKTNKENKSILIGKGFRSNSVMELSKEIFLNLPNDKKKEYLNDVLENLTKILDDIYLNVNEKMLNKKPKLPILKNGKLEILDSSYNDFILDNSLAFIEKIELKNGKIIYNIQQSIFFDINALPPFSDKKTVIKNKQEDENESDENLDLDLTQLSPFIIGNKKANLEYLDTIFSDKINDFLYDNILNQLEQKNEIEKDCKSGNLKAKKGLSTSFTKGGKWKLIKDLKNYPTHEEGGVDLIINKNGVSIKNNNNEFIAKYGLLIPKN